MRVTGSSDADEGEHRNDDDDEADEIDQVIHVALLWLPGKNALGRPRRVGDHQGLKRRGGCRSRAKVARDHSRQVLVLKIAAR